MIFFFSNPTVKKVNLLSLQQQLFLSQLEIDRFIFCQILIFLGKKDKKKKKKNKKEDEEDDLDKALADLKIEVNVDDDAAAKKKAKKVKRK